MKKKPKMLLAYMLALTIFSTYVVLDTFVITRVYGEESGSGTEAALQVNSGESSVSDSPTGDTGSDEARSTESSSLQSDSDESRSHGPDGNGGPPSGMPEHGDGSHNGTHSRPGSKPDGSSTDRSGSSSSSSDSSDSSSSGTAASTATAQDSYNDGNISIDLKEYTVNGSTVHVAEVSADDEYLKTAFAQGSYGKNVTAATSDIADDVNAILAINGDYYGAQEKGYVIRNGKLYRNTAVSGNEDLVIYGDGSFEIINESEVTAEELLAKGAVQTLSFGPALVDNGTISVDAGDEVGRAMASNPRTAIGIRSDGTYLFVVSDGRTDESEGLSLLELAEFMESIGAETAYNLDGGGSSTMVFNGSIVNTPTGGGIGNGSGSERKVSDIVYIGY